MHTLNFTTQIPEYGNSLKNDLYEVSVEIIIQDELFKKPLYPNVNTGYDILKQFNELYIDVYNSLSETEGYDYRKPSKYLTPQQVLLNSGILNPYSIVNMCQFTTDSTPENDINKVYTLKLYDPIHNNTVTITAPRKCFDNVYDDPDHIFKSNFEFNNIHINNMYPPLQFDFNKDYDQLKQLSQRKVNMILNTLDACFRYAHLKETDGFLWI